MRRLPVCGSSDVGRHPRLDGVRESLAQRYDVGADEGVVG